jgi:hypothetical protein
MVLALERTAWMPNQLPSVPLVLLSEPSKVKFTPAKVPATYTMTLLTRPTFVGTVLLALVMLPVTSG